MSDLPLQPGFAALGLGRRVVENLGKLGYRRAWPIQAAVAPVILEGRDVIGLAQTGRGKTAAFAAPVVELLAREQPATNEGRLRAVIMAPTRELAQQVANETEAIARGLRLRVACVYGKVGLSRHVEAVSSADIVIGTTGRLRELVDARAMSLAHVRHVVIDEADRMFDMGFLPQVRKLLESMVDDRQTLLFTATMPNAVETLAAQFQRDPERLEVDPTSTTVDHVERRLINVADRDKVRLLLHLLGPERPGALVFCGTRRRVGWVGAALRRSGIRADMIHGDRSQAQREKALARFAERDIDVLVATDVASRGLHIERVSTVVNYDVPPVPEDYVHRVGRAGHGGTTGEAFTFLGRTDRANWDRIVEQLDELLPLEEIDGFAPAVKTHEPGDGPAERDRSRQRRKGRSNPSRRRTRGAGRPIPPDEKPGGGVRKLG